MGGRPPKTSFRVMPGGSARNLANTRSEVGRQCLSFSSYASSTALPVFPEAISVYAFATEIGRLISTESAAAPPLRFNARIHRVVFSANLSLFRQR